MTIVRENVPSIRSDTCASWVHVIWVCVLRDDKKNAFFTVGHRQKCLKKKKKRNIPYYNFSDFTLPDEEVKDPVSGF